jgi:hypothetical protein
VIEQELRERIEILLDDDTQPDWSDVVARVASADGGRTPAHTAWHRGALSRRRVALVVALAAVIAAVAALLPGRIGSGHEHVGIVAEALAAVSQGPVLHAVLQVPTSQTWDGPSHKHPTIELLDLASGQTRPVVSQMELWYDPERGLALQVDSVNGTVAWASLQTPTTTYDDHGHQQASTSPAQIDPGLAAFLKGYKRSLADGTAIDQGPGTLDGRAIEWLRFPPLRPSGVPEEVAVDRDTFQAVAIRAICPNCTIAPPTYTITTLDGVSRNTVDFSPPKVVEPHPVKLYDASYDLGTLSGVTSYLGHQSYWAGNSVDGLAFTGVQFGHPTNYSSETASADSVIASGKGVTLYYGARTPPTFDAPSGQPYLSIGETADIGFAFHSFNMEELSEDGQPLTLARTTVPPDGEAILTDIGFWVVQLRKGDVYIEIEGPSREVVVDTARALTATP